MAELKPKRGFVNRMKFDPGMMGASCMVWEDENPDDDARLPVLVIPEPDRDPTPEEIEDLAEMIHDAVRPEAESVGGAKLNSWKDAALPYRLVWYMIARAAWKLGARVPHA